RNKAAKPAKSDQSSVYAPLRSRTFAVISRLGRGLRPETSSPRGGESMPADRLSALDESFLRIESPRAHMHVGWTLLADGDPPSIEELRSHVAARLEVLPRFRCRVRCSALHDPIWVDDPGFDISNHVISATLPAPGRRELRKLAGEMLSTP